jgi:hypothetical protein
MERYEKKLKKIGNSSSRPTYAIINLVFDKNLISKLVLGIELTEIYYRYRHNHHVHK